MANRRTLPEHPKKILSGIPERLHLLPESQKKTSETSRRLLPEYPGDYPQDVEETAHGTLGRRLTEHSRRTLPEHSGKILSGTYRRTLPEYPGVCPQGVEETAHGTLRRTLPERLERKCAKEWIFKGFYE